ncbi:hypothetical protein SUGI_0874670 [Cryptomeria japonica]|nr:hypothetical protein SUGI_0874670 [Cryptomeria japonica]
MPSPAASVAAALRPLMPATAASPRQSVAVIPGAAGTALGAVNGASAGISPGVAKGSSRVSPSAVKGSEGISPGAVKGSSGVSPKDGDTVLPAPSVVDQDAYGCYSLQNSSFQGFLAKPSSAAHLDFSKLGTDHKRKFREVRPKMLARIPGVSRGLSSSAVLMAEVKRPLIRKSLNHQTIMCRHFTVSMDFTLKWLHVLTAYGRFSTSSTQRDGEGRSESLAKDVFIGHSGKQKILARELHKDLTNKGVSCFFDEDPLSLPIAEKFPPRIFEAAEKCRVAVLVLSKDFSHSKWPMLELSAFLKAKISGKNPNMKILPLFFMISPKSLSEITEDNQVWKDFGIADETRAEWHRALREIRSIKGLEFKEAEDMVHFRDEVVKAICSLLLSHSPDSIQGQTRQDQVLDGLAVIPITLLQPRLQQMLRAQFYSNIVFSMDLLKLQFLVFFSTLICCSYLHQPKKMICSYAKTCRDAAVNLKKRELHAEISAKRSSVLQ